MEQRNVQKMVRIISFVLEVVTEKIPCAIPHACGIGAITLNLAQAYSEE